MADRADSPAKTREQADQRARRELVLSLQAKVQAEVLVRSRSEGTVRDGHASGELHVEVNELTQVLGEETIDGAAIAERFEEPRQGTLYSLAVMDREIAARNLAQRAGEALAEAAVLVSRADGGPRARSLQPLASAYALCLKARLGQQTHRVLVGREITGFADRGPEVRARLEALLADLRLEVVAGQSQEGAIGEPLPEPVVVRLTLREGESGVPVPGATLDLRPQHPGAVQLSAERLATADDGTARFTVPLVQPTGKEINHIAVALHLEGAGELKGPAVRVEYALPTRETLKVLVLLQEANLGRAVEPSSVALGVRDALRRSGYPVVDPGPLLKGAGEAALLGGDRQALRRLLSGRVDVLLRGRVEALAGGLLLGLPSVQARASVDGLDLRSGRVIASLHLGPEVEAHQSREEAGRRALKRLGKDVERGVTERLESLLAAPGGR